MITGSINVKASSLKDHVTPKSSKNDFHRLAELFNEWFENPSAELEKRNVKKKDNKKYSEMIN